MAVTATGVRAGPGVAFLLRSREPAIRRLARRDLLGEPVEDAPATGPLVRALRRGQRRDGGFGAHPYKKWQGAHWRLVSLVELEVAPDERLRRAAGTVLDWLTGPGHRGGIRTVDGLVRRCASQEGNALAACSRLGLAADERVALLARSLVEWQWPDGGWNCDLRASGRRSSFHESLPPLWGLHEYAAATGAGWAREAAERTAELLLEHRLFRSLRTGEPIRTEWLVPHHPPFWHYDTLRALVVLARLGLARDPRAAEAVDLLAARQRDDGTWHAGARWWRPPGAAGANVEAVDWGGRGPSEPLTLDALRVLRAAGRLSAPED